MEDSKNTNACGLCSIPKKECSLAIEYVAIQPWEDIYSDEEAFVNGTVFPALNLPFVGRKVQK